MDSIRDFPRDSGIFSSIASGVPSLIFLGFPLGIPPKIHSGVFFFFKDIYRDCFWHNLFLTWFLLKFLRGFLPGHFTQHFFRNFSRKLLRDSFGDSPRVVLAIPLKISSGIPLWIPWKVLPGFLYSFLLIPAFAGISTAVFPGVPLVIFPNFPSLILLFFYSPEIQEYLQIYVLGTSKYFWNSGITLRIRLLSRFLHGHFRDSYRDSPTGIFHEILPDSSRFFFFQEFILEFFFRDSLRIFLISLQDIRRDYLGIFRTHSKTFWNSLLLSWNPFDFFLFSVIRHRIPSIGSSQD